MLQIKEVFKRYKTGDYVQTALNGVSLTLRDHEFVAILGPSGSGKTTLLNIIGGLDRYDSGDLIINGISTKEYKDRDWDAYRNHTIGFVFQSYNLIPHQSVLSNVELALTLSGVSAAEKKERAEKALERVGLKDHMHKRPNQMSGGQMQRVAIARALVNEPDVILADEPTGALDSETSVQIMDILKEVASDKLVVMVTHNPELAEEYATRIVRVKDGEIIADTDPVAAEEILTASTKPPRTKLAFPTALGLSLNNLMTKKGRTALTAFAGAIGIIGIALILALSNGVNQYIDDMENQLLESNPIVLDKTTFDLGSMMQMQDERLSKLQEEKESGKNHDEDKVYSNNLVADSLTATESMIVKNDLGSFKKYLDEHRSEIEDGVSAIEYRYSITPMAFTKDGDEVMQTNPSALLKDRKKSMLGRMLTIYWNQLISSPDAREKQYELLAGEWPDSYDEIAVILNEDMEVSDYTLYSLGIMSREHLNEIADAIENEEEFDDPVQTYTYDEILGREYKVFAPCQMYRISEEKKDDDVAVWIDKSDDDEFLESIYEDGLDVKISCILKATEDASISSGVAYDASLTTKLQEITADSEIIKAQIMDPETNILTGKKFDEEDDKDKKDEKEDDEDAKAEKTSMKTSFSNKLDRLSYAESLANPSREPASHKMMATLVASEEGEGAQVIETVTGDPSEEVTPEEPKPEEPQPEEPQPGDDPSDTPSEPGEEGGDPADDPTGGEGEGGEELPDLPDIGGDIDLPTGYLVQFVNYDGTPLSAPEMVAEGASITQIPGIPSRPSTDAAEYHFVGWRSSADTRFHKQGDFPPPISNTVYIALFYEFRYDGGQGGMMPPGGFDIEQILGSLTEEQLAQIIANMGGMSGVDPEQMMASMIKNYLGSLSQKEIMAMMGINGNMSEAYIKKMMEDYMKNLSKDDLAKMFGVGDFDLSDFDLSDLELSDDALAVLMAQMSGSTPSTYEDVLDSLGYHTEDQPSGISIYPNSMEGKDKVVKLISDYNDQIENDSQKVTYTDVIALFSETMTDIVNAISYVLIAFVAISLIVSSIMIAIITYISVLERTKEIGVLRALGASKSDVSKIFNAETFIEGLISGVFGVVTSMLLCIPISSVASSLIEKEFTASVPLIAGAILVVISVILTLIAGFAPSRMAAKKDPVLALRSE